MGEPVIVHLVWSRAPAHPFILSPLFSSDANTGNLSTGLFLKFSLLLVRLLAPHCISLLTVICDSLILKCHLQSMLFSFFRAIKDNVK